jgi:formate dehydrogenase assembly factor FdhD
VNSLSSRKIISNALIVFKFNSEVFGIGYDLSPKIISKSHENPQRERVPHNESNQSQIKIKKTPLHLMAHNVMKRSKTALIH